MRAPRSHTRRVSPNKLPRKSCVSICNARKEKSSRKAIFSQDFQDRDRSLLMDILKTKKKLLDKHRNFPSGGPLPMEGECRLFTGCFYHAAPWHQTKKHLQVALVSASILVDPAGLEPATL